MPARPLAEAITHFRALGQHVGGCTDGHCLVTGPARGMHTNGGCKCARDRLKAAALQQADVKVIANTGATAGEGINSIGKLFSSAGGQSLGAMLESLAQSPAGSAVIEKVTGNAGA